ncbi:DUF3231 family protein [Halalkalibacter krulwichiae]|uniref:DUF3231 family protein n=1 Tax=Halalkalibacter krulwichiae TaxID=199441 RepID=A0A1X9MH01_9BACI|nr:DUF3231 family protein [Halalkalibacter krulwichiae]ARK32718.1 hypothetical protein BkAM31D_24250 [Halalkalibacter krulwichiae]
MEKGFYISSGIPEMTHKVDFIEHQNFLAGFFGDKRPLVAPEVTNLYANFQRNALGIATIRAFCQSATSKEVYKHFVRGEEIGRKHCEVLASHLKEHNLQVPLSWDTHVIESSANVFSDKLMMFAIVTLTNFSMTFYGLGLATSSKKDLGIMYNRFLAEIQLYSEDGGNILIENAWLESPPKV